MAINVLIIEDNAVARDLLSRVVRESFSDVDQITEASNLHAASQLVATPELAHRYQLVLLDLELPGGGALELLKKLTPNPITCIATSLYLDDEHLFPALQHGARGYLLKEDRFEVLVEDLQKIIRGQPPMSSAMARRVLNHFKASEQQNSSVIEDDARLNAREHDILNFMSKGYTLKEISSLVGLKWFTINDHIRSIYKKLSLSSQVAGA